MQIGTVMEITGLTRKAIYYYEQIGLISPLYNDENGYREYTHQHVELLNQIHWLRTIGIGFNEIAKIFDKTKSLNDVLNGRLSAITDEISHLNALRDSLEAFDRTDNDIARKVADWTKTDSSASRTAATELSKVFPGPLGVLFAIVFGPYLQTKVSTKTEKKALGELINSIDDTKPFEVPTELQEVFDGIGQHHESSDDQLISMDLDQIADMQLSHAEAAVVTDFSNILASAIEPYVQPFLSFFSKTSPQFAKDIKKFLNISETYTQHE